MIFPSYSQTYPVYFDEHALDDMIEDGHETIVNENPLNENFYKKEFQELWKNDKS